MRQPIQISVQESVSKLRSLQKSHPSKYKPLQMLISIREQGSLGKNTLASLLGASDKSITKWRSAYLSGGIAVLLEEHRGGHKKTKITAVAQNKLHERLHNPKEGFRSFIDIQQWLLNEFGVDMAYHAVNKYIKRKYGARLKVSRKSHVQKAPADEAVFKKPAREIRIY